MNLDPNLIILIAIVTLVVTTCLALVAIKVQRKRRDRLKAEQKANYLRLAEIINKAKHKAFNGDGDLAKILAKKLTTDELAMMEKMITGAEDWIKRERYDRDKVEADMTSAIDAWKVATSNQDRLEAGISLHDAYIMHRNSAWWDDQYTVEHDSMKDQLQGVMQSYFDELMADAPTSREAFNSLVVLMTNNQQLAEYTLRQWGRSRLPLFLVAIKRPDNWRQLVGFHRENPNLGDYFGDCLNQEQDLGQAILEASRAIRDNDWINARWLLAHCKHSIWQQEIGEMARSQLAYVSVNAPARSEQE